MSQGVYVLGGKCPGGKCPGGKCPGGICPWGKCPRGTCPGGYILEPYIHSDCLQLVCILNRPLLGFTVHSSTKTL